MSAILSGAAATLSSMGPTFLQAGLATTATGTGVGLGLFNYNRGNFKMDQKLHFGRFNAGQNMAIAQTAMYREDLTDLSMLTCSRMDMLHSVGAMSLTILTALFCPGRLGLHTVAPPGWLMGLFMINLAGCYLFLGLTMWLAMHASIRADTAATHMLTRFCRLPIPSTYMIDRARKFMANYEEQSWTELFRPPFMPHQIRKRGKEGGFNEGADLDPTAERHMRHGIDVPSWYRKEKGTDEQGHAVESMLTYDRKGLVPEHFEVYTELQNEWWPYDIYARVSIFLAHMHLFHAWTYQSIGHALQETRAVFACSLVVLTLSVTQQIIITLDVKPVPGQFPLERIGPLAQFFGFIAACIEYQRWYSDEALSFCFAFVYIAHFIHIIYTVQLLMICRPTFDKPPTPQEGSHAWWPGEWTLPAAFSHAVWLVAPPKELEPHLNDLAGELRAAGKKIAAGSAGQAKVLDAAKRDDVHKVLGPRQESPAWRNVQVALLAMLAAWVWLTFGFTIEVITQGTTHPSFLSAPGLANNARDPRWRIPKAGKEHAPEVGTGGLTHGPLAPEREDKEEGGSEHGASSEGDGRRLGGEEGVAEVAAKLRALLPHLRALASGKAIASMAPAALTTIAAAALAETHTRVDLSWPPLFEPRLLACGHSGSSLLLSRHGRGAVVSPGVLASRAASTPLSFALEGASASGQLLAASWEASGLLLATSLGELLECPGVWPAVGRWRCQLLEGGTLPLGQRRPFSGAVAISRQPASASFRLAIAYPGESTVVLFARASGRPGAGWLPTGEVRVGADVVHAAFHGEDMLLLTARDGSLSRLSLSNGRAVPSVVAAVQGDAHAWQGSCVLPTGEVARLALRPPASPAGAWEPTMFLSKATA